MPKQRNPLKLKGFKNHSNQRKGQKKKKTHLHGIINIRSKISYRTIQPKYHHYTQYPDHKFNEIKTKAYPDHKIQRNHNQET